MLYYYISVIFIDINYDEKRNTDIFAIPSFIPHVIIK